MCLFLVALAHAGRFGCKFHRQSHTFSPIAHSFLPESIFKTNLKKANDNITVTHWFISDRTLLRHVKIIETSLFFSSSAFRHKLTGFHSVLKKTNLGAISSGLSSLPVAYCTILSRYFCSALCNMTEILHQRYGDLWVYA